MEMQAIKMKTAKESTEAMCVAKANSLQAGHVRLFDPNSPKPNKKSWIAANSLWIEEGGRVFIPVVLSDRFFWTDAITGSLYDSYGKCKTSDVLTIDVFSLRNNTLAASKILMSAKSIEE